MHVLITALLWFGAIGCGLLGGLYFAFSTFIMTALGRIDRSHGVSAMNAINAAILRSVFMPFFYGTTLASLLLVVISFTRMGESGAVATLAGGLIYITGMFVCTVIRNVPLNNVLAAADAANGTAATVWARYLKEWTRWNHVRTVSSTAASALYIAAIAAT
jgi:uncharacterized membrane protein